jgi:hypothetical protein
MSKRTSYGKIYRPDVCVYSVDAVLSTHGFLPSTPMVKIASAWVRQRVHAGLGPRGRGADAHGTHVARLVVCTDAVKRPRGPGFRGGGS